MRNLLKSNQSAVWNGTNKTNENNTGGVALWTIPPQVHNAFNPSMFVRTKYYHLIEGYEPTRSTKPNYITIDNSEPQLVFQHATASSLFVECSTPDGKYVAQVYSGSTVWRLTNEVQSIQSIDRIGLTREELSSDPLTDSSYIYLRQGQTYEDDYYICNNRDSIIYRNDEVESTSLTIHTKGGNITLNAETFKGKVMFDVSEAIKSCFKDHLIEFKELGVMADLALYCRYSVKGIAGSGTTTEFMAVNAVSQIGESFDRTNEGLRILTRMPMLKKYEGYPLDFSVLSTEEGLKSDIGNIYPLAISRVRIGSESEINLLDEASREILNELSQNILLQQPTEIRIYRAQTPPQPFYVRWINDIGGVDYFMFSRQQKRTNSVKSVSTFSPFIQDTSSASTNLKVYAMDTESTITAGAEMLSKEEFDTIYKMPFSPLIEWYNEATRKWVRLSISKFDGSYYSKPETKGVEVTFVLPNINTQF